jgi:hypothetical protein
MDRAGLSMAARKAVSCGRRRFLRLSGRKELN